MSQGPSNNFARRIAALSPEQRELLRQRLKQEEVGAPRIPRLPRAAGRNSFVLSFAQQRLWFLEHLEPGTAAYNLPLVVLLTGELDAAALSRALGELVRRHESLRTSFALEGEAPAQVVEPELELPLPVTDLCATPEPEREAEVKRLVREEAARPFDLSRPPLIRIGLLRLGPREHVALLTMHHIISDAWSMGVLVREIAELYQAFAEGRPSPLAPLPVQYADYAAWQRGWLQGERLERQLDYWRGQLAGAPAALELPTDRPRPAVQTTRGAREEVLLPAELSARVRALTQRAGATPFVTLLAAFQALLSRHSRQDDVAVGTSVAGRNRAEVEGLIGYFINTLVLRARFEPGDDSAALLERVRRTVFDAQQHQDLPFEKLVDELQPERSMTRTPLFQVMFIMLPKLDVTQGDVTLPGLKMRAAGGDSGTAKFDLTLTMVDSEPGITGTLEYNTDLFDAATVRRLLGHYERLLEGMTEDPARPLASIPLLGEAERRQLLVGWNRTEAAAPESSRLHELFGRQARLKPASVAAAGSGRQLTYGELDARSNQLARRLRRMGVGPESLVAVCMGRSPELLVALLGVLKAGGAYVPLDAQFPTERLAFMLTDAAPRVLLTEGKLAGRVAEVLGGVADGPGVVKVDEEWGEIAAEGAGPVEERAGGDNLAYVIYTSGSTGRPKGVQVSHGAVVNFITAMSLRPGMSAADVLLAVTTLSFDIAGLELYLPLAVGGRVVLASGEEAADGAELLRLIEEHGVTVMQATPSTWRLMLGAGWEGTRGLKVLCGGEALPLALADQLLERSASLWNMYGPTETTIWSTTNRIESAGGPVHVGGPITNTQVYLLDECWEPVPLGVAGEVYIGGEGLARGYLGRPSLTAERFLPDPFSTLPGSRLYRAGDLARYDRAGRLHFLGRADYQVKLRGFRIELGEVESALMRHPRVRAAAAAVRPGPTGEPRLVAFVVTGGGGDDGDNGAGNGDGGNNGDAAGGNIGGNGDNGGGAIGAGELRRFVQGSLPEYMVPAHFEAVASLPLTPNGKVDRRALPELSGASVAAGAREYVAPRTEAERRLAGVWSEVLGAGRVGAEDNFFELGGDSILTLQVVARARREGVGVTARQVFQHQRLADLAAVASLIEPEEAEAAQAPVVGEVPLTPVQRWFFEQELEDRHHWNQAVMLAAEGEFDAERLERALAALVGHHDALRLRYRPGAAGWEQRIAAPGEPPALARLSLEGVPDEELEGAIEGAAAEAQRGLDLEEGPLVRAVLMGLGRGRGSRLLLVIHHLAVDGVSWRVLLEDLREAYGQLRRGEAVALPPKTASFKRWAEGLEALARSSALEAEQGYWLGGRWEGAEGATLPRDFEGGENTEATRRSVGVELGEDETGWLLHEVPAAYRTRVDEVLLAALAEVVAPRAPARKVLLDLEGHGREEIGEALDVTRTVGWFTTIYPVLLEVEAGAGEGRLLRSVKEQLRRVPRRGISYGLLRYLSADEGVRQALSRLPRAEISFNYLGQIDQLLSRLGGGDDAAGGLRLATEPAGPARSPRARRSHLIDVTAGVAAGRLWVRWDYSERAHSPETMRSLGEEFLDALRRLIAHCRGEEAGGFTPSDFPLVEVGEEELERLSASHPSLEDLYPLSPLQHGLLFHSLSAPSDGLYFNQLACRLTGPLDPSAFARAWRQVLRRHPALRACFAWEGLARPLQVIHADPPLGLSFEDWSSVDEGERERRWAGLLREERRLGFDVGRAPLMRLRLVGEGGGGHRFLWCYHHALLDGWSAAVVIKEALAAYAAEAVGGEAVLGAARPYGEYLGWLKGRDVGEAEGFWRRRLAALPEAARGVSRPAGASASAKAGGETDGGGAGEGGEAGGARYGEVVTHLGAERTASLRALARSSGLTLGTVVTGAWALVLSRSARSRRVVFGVTTSGRPEGLAGAERMVGLFINTLPAVVEVDERGSAVEWLRRLQEEAAEWREYEHTPLWEVAGWAGSRGSALFETLVVYENYPEVGQDASGGAGGVRVGGVETAERTNYGLTLVASEGGGELVVRAAYDGEGYGEADARRLLGRVERVLGWLAEAGAEGARGAAVADIEWIPRQELEQVLNLSRGPRRGLPPQACVHELFEHQARLNPAAVAVASRDEFLTYAELDARANRLARRLRRMGVGPDSLVGVCMGRSASLVVSLLAVLKAGGAYVPLDAQYPAERIAFMLTDAAPRVLLTEGRLAGRLVEVLGGAADGPVVVKVDEEWDEIAAEGDGPVEERAGGENLAYVIYTSGSTGRPKAAMVEHRSLVNCALETAEVIGLDGSQRFLLFASLSFDVSVFQIFSSLVSGASVALHEAPAQLSNPEIWRLCEDLGITVLDLPTAFWHQWLDEMAALGRPLGDPVRVYMTGGEKVSAEKIRAWSRMVERPCTFITSYGLTETTICNAMYACASDAPDELGAAAVPVGRLLANTELYVLDERMRPLPVGVVGELYVGGAGVVRGYRNCPDLTAERFLPDPFAGRPGARLYRTGDLGLRREDGNVEVLGRVDEQVKIRGYRVELSEVEKALCEHARVQEAVVLAREDEPGVRRLVAYVVTAPGAGLTTSELRGFVRGRLPEHMVPALYVRLDRMPLTPNSKVDRRALPPPDGERPELEAEYVAPQTEAERLVAGVWQEVLKLGRVGLHDNFFDSGGDSMLVMQVYGRLREVLDREIPMVEMFRNPTVYAMAKYVREGQGAREAPVEEAQGRGSRQRDAMSRRGRLAKERKRNA